MKQKALTTLEPEYTAEGCLAFDCPVCAWKTRVPFTQPIRPGGPVYTRFGREFAELSFSASFPCENCHTYFWIMKGVVSW